MFRDTVIIPDIMGVEPKRMSIKQNKQTRRFERYAFKENLK